MMKRMLASSENPYPYAKHTNPSRFRVTPMKKSSVEEFPRLLKELKGHA